jgi:hypothetical protein
MALEQPGHAQFANMFQWLSLCIPLAINSANTQVALKMPKNYAKWKKNMVSFGFT